MIRTNDWTVSAPAESDIEASKAAPNCDWLLVRQMEHARLAGVLARRWQRLDHLLSIAPIREAFVWAAFHHDDGWQDWDSNPAIADGRPISFSEMRRSDSRPIWAHSINAAEKQGPIQALLVASHFLILDAPSGNTEPSSPSTFAVEFEEKRAAWHDTATKKLQADNGTGNNLIRQELQVAAELLRLFDFLSLILCIGKLTSPKTLAFPDDQPCELRRTGPASYSISPWPFDAAEGFTESLEVLRRSGNTGNTQLASTQQVAADDWLSKSERADIELNFEPLAIPEA